MKRLLTGILAGTLSLALLAGAVGAVSGANRQTELALADALTLQRTYADGDGAVKEQILAYTPGGDVEPVVVYGDTLYGRSTMDYLQAYMADKDFTVVGAVNAAFFDMSTGIPYGMVVTDGVLRTSGNVPTVGIEEDGSLVIGTPNLKVTMTYVGGDTEISYNKALTETNGFCLYSQDYDYVTKNSHKGYYLVLEADRTELTTDCTMEAKVVDIETDASKIDIPEDGFVVGLAMDTAYSSAMASVKKVKKGDTLTFTVTVDKAWKDVAYAVGGGELLVENGKALTDFTLDTADKEVARTALGLKANGDVVVYTVDKGSGSDGLTLEALARRMQDLGCVTAVNLDGGGSTCLGVTQPGDTAFTTVNNPSDGKQRECANYIFFVRPTKTAGAATRLHLYPYDAAALPGGQIDFTAKATDRNYMAASVPTVSWTASGGFMDGSTFTAGSAGTATVKASGGGLNASASVLVVESPTSLEVYREDQDKALESLTLENGAEVDLTARALYLGTELAARDDSFTWELSPELGTVTEDGLLTAGEDSAKGMLTVSCGETSVSIPVEVKGNPFVDTRNHWAKEYITALYFEGVLEGSKNSAGEMVYRPDDSMTRQEFICALIRWLDIDVSEYQSADMPFADKDQIASWAEDAMKAAYRLGYVTGSGSGGKLYVSPTDTITREEAMTILARTSNSESYTDALERFSDADTVSSWAVPALTAMVEQGVIDGVDGKLLPRGNVTRAQVAKMLYAME